MSKDQVHADLADLAASRKRGRMSEDELVIFDSSGSGVRDVAAAWVAYCEARRTGIGGRFDLSGPAKEQ
jgi:alanine dehydrogenase